MPIYEYTCRTCGNEFEELTRAMKDSAATSCPRCGSRAVDRRFSVFAARSGAEVGERASEGGGCRRCGDPNGPCAI
jgi:putative FmdB family regulatory protein